MTTLLILMVLCFVSIVNAENLFDIIVQKDSTALLKLMKAITTGGTLTNLMKTV